MEAAFLCFSQGDWEKYLTVSSLHWIVERGCSNVNSLQPQPVPQRPQEFAVGSKGRFNQFERVPHAELWHWISDVDQERYMDS